MPQSLVKNYVHIVFSTKQRQPFIHPSVSKELYAYLGGICKNRESFPIEIGGYTDHVHILCLLSRKIALMELTEELKAHSSKWMKEKGDEYKAFYWQKGYGGFSINPTEIEIARKYIADQNEHHKKEHFKMNIGRFLINTGWNMMSDMCGINSITPLRSFNYHTHTPHRLAACAVYRAPLVLIF